MRQSKTLFLLILVPLLSSTFHFHIADKAELTVSEQLIPENITSKDHKHKSIENLPSEIQTNIHHTLNNFQGGFMRSPDGQTFILKSSTLTMIFRQSEVFVQVPIYEKYRNTADIQVIPTRAEQMTRISSISQASLSFTGSNLIDPVVSEPSPAKYSYLKGDQSKWIQSSPYFTKLVYYDIYPKIDLVYTFLDGKLKYEFHVHPNAEHDNIRLNWQGDVTIEKSVNGLVVAINTPKGPYTITDNNPINFLGNARLKTISGDFKILNRNSYGFNIDTYPKTDKLIIDPTMDLGFSTFLGGLDFDESSDIALDNDNNVYLTGQTYDPGSFPTTTGAYDQLDNGMVDAYIAKLSSDGSTLLFSTLLGGEIDDFSNALALDDAGNIYITGYTGNSTVNYPTISGSINETHNGGEDVFVSKISADGSALLGSTFLGGDSNDRGTSIFVDDSNDVYVTGYTYDSTVDFPTTPGALNEIQNGFSDAFIVKISSDITTLQFSTFIGGQGSDSSSDITLDEANNVYITGTTIENGINFPTSLGAMNSTYTGNTDVFVSKLSSDLSTLLSSTLIGGSEEDTVFSLAIDSSNNMVITGRTQTGTTDFPTTANAYNTSHNGGTYDAFVAKISNDATTLLNSTLIGGNNNDVSYSIALDGSDNVYIGGFTVMTDQNYPTTFDTFDDTHGGSSDGFITKLSADLSQVLISSFLGAENSQSITALTVDASYNVYVTGYTAETVEPFPTTPGAYDEFPNGIYDVFVTKFLMIENQNPSITAKTDFTYEYGTNGNEIEFTLGDFNPGQYNVTRNNVLIVPNTNWSNGTYSLDIDGLSRGLHNITVTATDHWGNSQTHTVQITVTEYDLQQNLEFSTFIGGADDDVLYDITVDNENNIYITGYTVDALYDFPFTFGTINTTHNGLKDVFISKLSSDGSTLLFSTYIGGMSDDEAYAIKLDNSGNIYITGQTDNSTINFPTTSEAYDLIHNGGFDAFVAKLTPDGSALIFSTFVGGNANDYSYDMELDAQNNIYFTGYTTNFTISFPTTSGSFNETHSGGNDAYITKLAANGSTLLYSTLIGGQDNDVSFALELDDLNNAYIVGYTADALIDYPTTIGAYDQTHNGGVFDVFATKVSSDGSSLVFSTLIGGGGIDNAWDLELDTSNNLYLIGSTTDAGVDYPTTAGAFDESHNGGNDIFVSKLAFDGSSLLSSTFIGGFGEDYPSDLVLGENNSLFLTGRSFDSTTDFPTTFGSFNETHNGGVWDAFITQLSPDCSQLLYSSFIGGTGLDNGLSVDLDSDNNLIVGGMTDSSTNFPTTFGSFNTTFGGASDVFVLKFAIEEFTQPITTEPADQIIEYGTQTQITWIVNDKKPGTYSINVNNTIYTPPTQWTNGEITIDVIDFEIGEYNFSLSISDYWGNTNTDNVTIIVEDTTSPLIEPTDTSVVERGSTGNVISWTVSDLDPSTYDIYRNDTRIIESNNWNSGDEIQTNIDTQDLGFWNYTIVIFDSSGNFATDTVIIQVVDTTIPVFSISDNNPGSVEAGGNMTIFFDDESLIYKVEYKWNEEDLQTATNLNSSSYTLNALGRYYFSIEVPSNLSGLNKLTLYAFDIADNMFTVNFQVNVVPLSDEDGGFELTPEQRNIIIITVASILILILLRRIFGRKQKAIRPTTRIGTQILDDTGIVVPTGSNIVSEDLDTDIFISFSSRDLTIAEKIYDALKENGLKPWISSKSIVIGQDYSEQIVNAIDRSKDFILIVSDYALNSRHVKTELERGFSKNLTILPIKITKTNIPSSWEYYLSGSQWQDYSNYSDDTWIPRFISFFQKTPTDTNQVSENTLISEEKVNLCFLCLSKISDLRQPCETCGQRCEICKRSIIAGEKWTTCAAQSLEACLNSFHESEYLEWIKVNGTCPYCKQYVPISIYETTSSFAEKLALIIAQKFDETEPNEIDRITNDTIGSAVSSSKMYQKIETISNQIETLETFTRGQFQTILSKIEPLVKEFELIRELTFRIEENMVTQTQLESVVSEILANMDTIETNLEILVEAHKKHNSLRNKIKDNLVGNTADYAIKTTIEEAGIQDELNEYLNQPQVGKLKSLLGKVKTGISNNMANPKSWLKLASVLFVI